MDLNTLNEANELYEKYQLCEKVLESLSDPNYKKTCTRYGNMIKDFMNKFHDEMLMFVNVLMVKTGMAFEDLHCPCRPEEDDENSTEQENPKL